MENAEEAFTRKITDELIPRIEAMLRQAVTANEVLKMPRDIYEVPDEIVKANAEAMKRMDEAVTSPSQEDVDDAVSGWPKKTAETVAKRKERDVKKDIAPEKPEAAYKTRDMKPGTRKSEPE